MLLDMKKKSTSFGKKDRSKDLSEIALRFFQKLRGYVPEATPEAPKEVKEEPKEPPKEPEHVYEIYVSQLEFL